MSYSQFVLYSTELGVFLGHALGLCFWSRLDPAGQDTATTFDSTEAALAFVVEHDPQHKASHVGELRVVPVSVERKGGATVAECVAAGLPEWNPLGKGDAPVLTRH